ncbi:DUF89 family protein [Candidatus Bipolaricaulota bacterium]|nr:DUF89 family protein [Candidatus Bipolaricaulota bacterium]
MRTYLECFPCLLQQTLTAARQVTSDPERQRTVLEAVSRELPKMDLDASPADNGNTVHQIARQILDCDDPFRAIKEASNRSCLEVVASYRHSLTQSTDPLLGALRLAAAANAIDVGPSFGHDYDVSDCLDKLLEGSFDFRDYVSFREDLDATDHVLYLADNAGEIVFDRLVAEQLSAFGKQVTFVVRGGPILNDATMEDARFAGIHEFADVIASGQRGPGTSLRLADSQFANRVRNADLILSKGQGNYEGLSEEQLRIYFLFRVKCSVVAQHASASMGTMLLRSGIDPARQDQDQSRGRDQTPGWQRKRKTSHNEAPGSASSTGMSVIGT